MFPSQRQHMDLCPTLPKLPLVVGRYALANRLAELILGDLPREVANDKLGTLNVRVSKLNATELPIAISSKPGAPNSIQGRH